MLEHIGRCFRLPFFAIAGLAGLVLTVITLPIVGIHYLGRALMDFADNAARYDA